MKLRITVQGVSYDVDVEVLDAAGAAPAAGAPVAAPPVAARTGPAAGAARGVVVKAPIAGTVVQVKVKPGDAVADKQALLVMEAMKMETNISSPQAGRIKTVSISPGQAVKAGEALIEFE